MGRYLHRKHTKIINGKQRPTLKTKSQVGLLCHKVITVVGKNKISAIENART